jgi:hypothetical protein
MFECLVEFRNIRAELIHSKEAFYTAWIPPGDEDLVIDWSVRAVENFGSERLEPAPRADIHPYSGQVLLSQRRMDQAQSDLIDYLVRSECLRLFYNPSMKWYSKLGEGRQEFVRRVMEEAVTRLQPELKELARRLQLQLEQLREMPLPEDSVATTSEDLVAIRRRMIAAFQSKLDALIMSNPEGLSRPLLEIKQNAHIPDQIKEIHEELNRIERDVFHDLNSLLAEYSSQANECEEYIIRLQPTDIKVIRRARLWVPV